MTNEEVRRWYVEQTARIPRLNEEWIAQGLALMERALAAWQFRHDVRLEARRMMLKPADVRVLQRRDTARYGHPDGPTFEWLVAEAEEEGLKGDEVFEAIIAGAYRTDAGINKTFGL